MNLHRLPTLADTLALLQSDHSVRPLAGGTDLIVQQRNNPLAIPTFAMIDHLPELREIDCREDAFRIGACVRIGELMSHPAIASRLSWLTRALTDFASPQIRNRATIGGNIANGSPTADTVPMFLVLDADLDLVSAEGSRTVPLRSFFTGYKKNILRKGEIIGAIVIPPADTSSETPVMWRKIALRNALAIAKVGVAGRMQVSGGRIVSLAVAVSAMSEYPRRLDAFESALRGTEPDTVTPRLIRDLCAVDLTPITDFRSDADYRMEILVRLLHRWIRRNL